jgi:acylglycerol lipase
MCDAEVRKKYSMIPGNEYSFPDEDFYQFFTCDGIKLHTYRFPSDSPQLLLISFHGMHEYQNSYAVVAKTLFSLGAEVVGIDWRGHGKSEGPRGLLPSFPVLLNDCLKFVDEMQKHYPGLPIFLFGHSLGACISLHISEHRPGLIKGMMLMSPALGIQSRCEGCFRTVLRCFGPCCPGLRLIRPNLDSMSSDQNLIDYLHENKCVYTDRVRLGTIYTAAAGMNSGASIIKEIFTPFVAIQGTADVVVNPKMAELLYQNAPAEDKNIWIYEGLSHGLMFEKEIYEICNRMQKWLEERMNRLN